MKVKELLKNVNVDNGTVYKVNIHKRNGGTYERVYSFAYNTADETFLALNRFDEQFLDYPVEKFTLDILKQNTLLNVCIPE